MRALQQSRHTLSVHHPARPAVEHALHPQLLPGGCTPILCPPKHALVHTPAYQTPPQHLRTSMSAKTALHQAQPAARSGTLHATPRCCVMHRSGPACGAARPMQHTCSLCACVLPQHTDRHAQSQVDAATPRMPTQPAAALICQSRRHQLPVEHTNKHHAGTLVTH